MKTTSRLALNRRAGFTLVELLVVIAIIALLAGVAFPSFGSFFKRLKRDQARTLAQSLVNSVKGYYTEYSRYPLPEGFEGGEVTPLRTDEVLTGALMGSDQTMNPKKISFLPELKTVEPGKGFGLMTEGEVATIVDPWSEEYYIIMDTDYSNSIDNPNLESTNTKLFLGVIVWSAGEDKDPNTWGDNIMSWETGKSKNTATTP